MIKQMKKILNIPLVKSYQKKDTYDITIHYVIFEEKTKNRIVDSSRLFKSIREINKYEKAIFFNILKVKLEPVHIILLAKGLKDCFSVKVRIFCGLLSPNTIYQFKNLLRIKDVQLRVHFRIENDLKLLSILNTLGTVSSWGNRINIRIYLSNNMVWVKFEEKTLEKLKLTIFERNSKKIDTEYTKESLEKYSFEYFKSIICLPKNKVFGKVYLEYYFKELNE